MRILIFSQHYPPESIEKPHLIAKAMARLGHEVEVLTTFPNHPERKLFAGYRQSIYKIDRVEGIKVTRVPIYPYRGLSLTRRSLSYLSFVFFAAIPYIMLNRRSDLVFVYHPPLTPGLLAGAASLLLRTPFVFEVQDIWPDEIMASRLISKGPLFNMINKMASFAYSRASVITVHSPGFKKSLEKKGVPSDKIEVIYNWAYENEEAFLSGRPCERLSRDLGLENRFNILYAGNIGRMQGLDNVIKAAALLGDIKDLQFVFLGAGVESDRLKKMAADIGLENVRFLPRIGLDRMPDIYAMADLVMVHLIDSPVLEIAIPGKTQSCLLSARPIVVSARGEAWDLVKKAGAGLAAEPMNPEDLAKVVRKFYNMPREEREAMGQSGRRYYIENLSSGLQLGKYASIFAALSGKGRKKTG